MSTHDVRRALVILVAVACSLAGCGGGETAEKAPSPGAGKAEPEKESSGLAPFGLTKDGDCPLNEQQVSEILETDVMNIPTPGALCAFGVATADLTHPSLAIAFGPEEDTSSFPDIEPRPEWDEGALYLDQGCQTSCTGNGVFPIPDGNLIISSNSGADGSAERTEQQIVDVLALLKGDARGSEQP